MSCVVQGKLDAGVNEPKHVTSANQLVVLLTKPPRRSRVQFICDKLDVHDVYTPAWGKMLCKGDEMGKIIINIYILESQSILAEREGKEWRNRD